MNLNWSSHLTFDQLNIPDTDKIILPPSVLEFLVNQAVGENLPSPLVFKVTNLSNGKYTHVGVREFSAHESMVLLPTHVMKQLAVDSQHQQSVQVELVDLPKGTGLTIKPLGINYDIEDWKVFLESKLRSAYTALTKGDVLSIQHADHTYELLVEDIKPDEAVCIVDTDLDLNILPDSNSEKVTSFVDVSSTRSSRFPMALSIGDSINVDGLQSSEDNTFKGHLTKWDRDLPINITISQGENPSDDMIESICVFVGSDLASTNPKSFLWSNLSTEGPCSSVTIMPTDLFLGDELYIVAIATCDEEHPQSISFNLNIDQTSPAVVEQDSEMQKDLQSMKCGNCNQMIPSRSIQLHTTFCERNNIVCPQGCGKVFPKHQGIPNGHWHCQNCNGWGNSKLSFLIHENSFHKPIKCDCGQEFVNLVAAAQHRSTTCGQKLHICRFCHLLVPQEEGSPSDLLNGLSGHESYCGSRTTDCSICKRAVRLREMEIHMEIHNQQRLRKSTPLLCLNSNCSRLAGNNQLNMCGICYGPLHSTVHDPTGSKLRSRIERRYVIQLTRGCGKPWCMNRFCVTSNPGIKRSMTEVMTLVKELMKQQEFKFCVEEMATKRRMFIDYQVSEGVYAPGWCAKAISEAKGNEREAQRWLEQNAVKLIEQQ